MHPEVSTIPLHVGLLHFFQFTTAPKIHSITPQTWQNNQHKKIAKVHAQD